jgi:Hypothetical protein (DUF2513)
MKRDMDLVRAILNEVEMKLPPMGGMREPEIDGYDQGTIFAHVELLHDAGLINARIMRGANHQGAVHIIGLTWAGHDFIDAAKDNTIWNKVKASVFKHATSVPFDVLLELLKAEAKKQLGLG